jgi:flagellar basal-body rod protein FlgG
MVPPNADFYVDETGNIWDDIGIVDQINIVTLTEGSTLSPMGPSTFKLDKGGTEASAAMVRQGYIERANVNPVESMTELITLQRHFDAMQKLIQTFSTIDSRAARDLGSING